ncbi:MAG TPA: RagB/SusD family nutrient uptake outer membrane protein [Muricauda sp.]|uniref:RagB/SusD family nutrient uptake outer membrane protein n=1 Tax=Flagellimonas aurea TaxID=2915619 RepID=UPI000C5872F9|nr:RagB/SusD family nutrient uptake outer membrane protein [uncultured Allomuricauda sp.]MBC73721.1 RagB/SusD family nutrient uptake outer membrane protein [Allomuricauda sp.]HBU77696.1 RagB/SusD family nutrient uptake outer membrane protein [Allomuricauda sp.]|tara:strand:- start:1063 stop:2823 length:1761 start_codon:yes stop_codon:yes gene_type:complete
MKKIIYILGLFVFFASCSDVLDIEDLNNYSPESVWNDENLANAYMVNLYPMFGNWNAGSDRLSQQLAGIEWYADRITISNENFKNWDYYTIRLINQAILDVESGTLPQPVKDRITGEALFMRAYRYFDMVVYHGGVPYIKVPQDRYEDDLYVPRNSTEECFDFIIEDLDRALELLPESIGTGSDEYGKIDSNFALAFKAKVLLYKASPQFNPTQPWDNAYWSEAHAVNKNAYETLLAYGYGLVEDYANIALEERNKEVVFSVINSYPNKTASWDSGVRPGSESRGPANACPTWEFVKEFPMKDGRLYNDPLSAYNMTDEEFLQNYWENRDPRFDKSIVWNGKIYEVSGKTGKRQYTALGIANELDDFGINPNANTNSTNLDRYTGFFIQKNSLLSLTQAEVEQYDLDYVLMRFAEVMLNYAETANETGNPAVALDILKQIRERAGIEAGADGNFGISASSREEIREAILAERNIEFCFEGHRFWDLRRLRMLDRLDGATKHGVEAIAITEEGSEMAISTARSLADDYELIESDFKYSILQVPLSGVKESTLPDNYYFFPIQADVINKNPQLEQNEGWGGSFDPTLN